MPSPKTRNISTPYLFLLILFVNKIVAKLHWEHSADLDENYRLLWSIQGQEITFEVRVRALGYVGFGFSRDGKLPGSDIAVGWIDRAQIHFQDRHVMRHSNLGNQEPVVDPTQDYILLLGYENATHTVLRFKRKLDTCDTAHDIPITNDTMRVVFMYSNDKPRVGSLPNFSHAFKDYRPLFITQKFQQIPVQRTRILDLRNEDVELPIGDDTLYWCKMFKLEDINRKHHLIRYEPFIDSTSSLQYLQHITLYECQGNSMELEEMAREHGRKCRQPNNMPLSCNAIVASWSRGSEGFTFPPEAGYPLDSRQAKYYLMETHYNNPYPDFSKLHSRQMADSSGLKIYFTHSLRPNDAGVLSIGMDPSWRHIIPPGQQKVISEGQCIEDCTGYAFPQQGINIFAVMMKTHLIGKEVKLRQIRQKEELPPIAHDKNIDPSLQDYRRLANPVRSLPGDRLIAECIYDSSSRNAITLGGLTRKEETCTVLTLYYPRQKKLTSCHSLPSLPTVLHSLGIEELAMGSNPVLISLPRRLAGMTLESRLISYDWENQFDKFQQATLQGTFKPLCWGAKNQIIPGSENLEGYSVNVTQKWKPPLKCKPKRLYATTSEYDLYSSSSSSSSGSFGILQHDDAADGGSDDDDVVGGSAGTEDDDNVNQNIRGKYRGNIVNVNADDFSSTSKNLIEGAVSGKVSRSSATESLGLSSASNLLVEQTSTKAIAMITTYSLFYCILLNTLNISR